MNNMENNNSERPKDVSEDTDLELVKNYEAEIRHAMHDLSWTIVDEDEKKKLVEYLVSLEKNEGKKTFLNEDIVSAYEKVTGKEVPRQHFRVHRPF